MKHTPPAAAVLVSLAVLAVSPGYAQDATPDQSSPVTEYIEQLDSDPRAALSQAEKARDAALAAWPSGDIEQLVDAVEHHAIVRMLSPLPASARQLLVEVWASHPLFMGALARVYTDANDGATVSTIAQAIAEGQPEALTAYPELAAAVCVVLDRPRTYPGLGSILPSGAEVFHAFVFAHQDRRVAALPLDELPAEVLVHMADVALSGDGIRTIIQDRRRRDPLELYQSVPYRQSGLLAGEPAPPPEDFTFDRIAERGGLGPLRGFYAEQLGQAFGYPVALATGHLADERFMAPVFLELERRGYQWNLEAIPDHPELAFGTVPQPATGEPMPLAELLLTADLAESGAQKTRRAWALIEAAQAAPESARGPMLRASQSHSMGFARAWRRLLELDMSEAAGEPDGPQRVLTEFFGQADRVSPMLATRMAIEVINGMGSGQREMLEWLSLTSRRDPHRYAAAQLALGDLALSQGDRDAAKKAYEDLVNRQAGETPLVLDAIARLETLISQDGREVEVFELYGRTHRRFRTPRTSREAEVRASGFMVLGERYEALLRNAGREREADRLRRQLDRALP